MNIRVNDIPLISLDIDGQCSSMLSFNHLIMGSGIVNMIYELKPLEGLTLDKEAYLHCMVRVYDESDKDIESYREELAKYESDHNIADLPFMVHSDSFFAKVPYSFKGWKDSICLEEVDNLYSKVYNQYNNILALMHNKVFVKLEALYAEKETNFNVSMYMNEQEQKDRMNSLREYIESASGIVPLDHTDYIEFAADKRLVRLNKTDGDSALRLIDEENEEYYCFDIWLHMKQGSNELTII